jgi:asparagine synthase (glutamine-hydrolysing)
MRGILPEAVRCRKDKKGFITPEERWFKIDFKNELRAMLKDSISMSKGLFNDSVLDRFDDMVNGKTKFDLFFWRVIVLSHWMKVYDVEVDFE